MTKLIAPTPRRQPMVPADLALAAPAWARAWATKNDAAVVTMTVPGARGLDGESFRQQTADAYRRIREALDATPFAHVVRVWNHIPGIHDRMDDECDRYMLFNAGRFAAVCEWFGGAARIPQCAAAASGVGHDGDDLVIHALAQAEPGTPVDNPQQIPAFRYSRRFGPMPPCFARATRVERPRRSLLIAGTAAITGEESRHVGDADAQLAMTLQNIRILVREAGWRGASPQDDPLDRLEHVRVYIARGAGAERVAASCREAFHAGASLEFIRADLCRTDLLVEIEGIASLHP
ncbi:MAG: hypothetical protein WBD40_16665 [Tepidisphaeraceae bacterium]